MPASAPFGVLIQWPFWSLLLGAHFEYQELLYHRAHRPWQVDAGGQVARAHRDGAEEGDEGAVPG